jgi:predicted TIM-barrel fold metal-dependent hydrolase
MTTLETRPAGDLRVVDADTHLTEPWDLWTSRAPSSYEDRVPRVTKVNGKDTWVFDGAELGPARAGGCIRKDGSKIHNAEEMFSLPVGFGHAGASEVGPRLALMDELGIWAHLVYPNTIGFGGQRFMECNDEKLRGLVVTIFNDAMAEIQEVSGQRLFPMGLLPWWDVDASLEEMERIRKLGLKGINTSTDPQDHGFEDLGTPLWDPVWAAAAEAGLPVNFHIGASFNAMTFYGNSYWPSLHDDMKMALGSCMMFLLNARVMGNFIYSGVLERHPTLKVVSVESGIGWIPFMLEALDYQLREANPESCKHLSMLPSEYFKRQIYACFWFEENNVLADIERIGVDNCLFETDYPHPTCLYPDSIPRAMNALRDVDEPVKRKLLSENAARVYSLPIP